MIREVWRQTKSQSRIGFFHCFINLKSDKDPNSNYLQVKLWWNHAELNSLQFKWTTMIIVLIYNVKIKSCEASTWNKKTWIMYKSQINLANSKKESMLKVIFLTMYIKFALIVSTHVSSTLFIVIKIPNFQNGSLLRLCCLFGILYNLFSYLQ